jgi:hypothetical protein
MTVMQKSFASRLDGLFELQRMTSRPADGLSRGLSRGPIISFNTRPRARLEMAKGVVSRCFSKFVRVTVS